MKFYGAFLAVIGVLGIAGGANAFDTGHHYDLTREAMSEFQMSEHAIQIGQVENWLVDYYSSHKAEPALKADLKKLHFDDLSTTTRVRNYWGRLTVNTKQAVEEAAKADDPMKVLAITGMSLHAVQDFYTHSNWVETHPGFSNAYSTRTWFDVPPPLSVTRIVTGAYPNHSPVLATDHGNYSAGMNHDSYVRPRWDEAYVYAYSASVQWVAAIEKWVNAIDPRVWRSACKLELDSTSKVAGLNKDRAAVYKISEWVKWGEDDGHWKGNGSGSGDEWAKYLATWMASNNSTFVHHFKTHKWHQLLTNNLTGATPPDAQVPAIPSRPLLKKAVRVRTKGIEELPVGFFETKMDVLGTPDFVGQVTIDGQVLVEAMQLNKSVVAPAWWSIKFVDREKSSVKINYTLLEEDASSSEICDINPVIGKKQLDFTLSLFGSSITGDITGTTGKNIISEGVKDDNNRARIILVVDYRDLRQ